MAPRRLKGGRYANVWPGQWTELVTGGHQFTPGVASTEKVGSVGLRRKEAGGGGQAVAEMWSGCPVCVPGRSEAEFWGGGGGLEKIETKGERPVGAWGRGLH